MMSLIMFDPYENHIKVFYPRSRQSGLAENINNLERRFSSGDLLPAELKNFLTTYKFLTDNHKVDDRAEYLSRHINIAGFKPNPSSPPVVALFVDMTSLAAECPETYFDLSENMKRKKFHEDFVIKTSRDHKVLSESFIKHEVNPVFYQLNCKSVKGCDPHSEFYSAITELKLARQKQTDPKNSAQEQLFKAAKRYFTALQIIKPEAPEEDIYELAQNIEFIYKDPYKAFIINMNALTENENLWMSVAGGVRTQAFKDSTHEIHGSKKAQSHAGLVNILSDLGITGINFQ